MMRMVSICILLVLAMFATEGEGASQNAKKRVKEKSMSVADPCLLVKGGLGIVNADLYIDVTSAKNKLLYGKDENWSGLDWSESEVVVFSVGRFGPLTLFRKTSI